MVIVVGIGLAAVKEQADLHLPGGDGCDFGGLPGGFGLLLGLGVGGGAAGGQAQGHKPRQKKGQDALFHRAASFRGGEGLITPQ